MTKRKPTRGQCDVCGCAVVVPGDDEAVGQAMLAAGVDTMEVNGHVFEWFGDQADPSLRSVRCPQHGGRGWQGFQRPAIAHDVVVTAEFGQQFHDKWAGGRHRAR